MTTAVTTVLASCHRLLLGRPSLGHASQPAQAEHADSGFDPDSCGAGLAVQAFRSSRHAQGARDASRHAPQWG